MKLIKLLKPAETLHYELVNSVVMKSCCSSCNQRVRRNYHHHTTLLLQVSASPEVLPPWKQGDYVAEASYTTVRSMTSVSSAAQLHMEKHWEQQVTATREVRRV